MTKRKAPTKRKRVKKAKLEVRKLYTDERGYTLYRISFGKQEYYVAGCQCLSKEEAVKHWSSPSYPVPERAAKFLKALDRVGRVVTAKGYDDNNNWGHLYLEEPTFSAFVDWHQ